MLLHHVLDARQRLLYWHWGLWATSLLGELQDGHVAQGTHLPHLQPLNEAPVRKRMTKDGIFIVFFWGHFYHGLVRGQATVLGGHPDFERYH